MKQKLLHLTFSLLLLIISTVALAAPAATITITEAICVGEKGSATITIADGTELSKFTYYFSGNNTTGNAIALPSSPYTISDLDPGVEYTLEVNYNDNQEAKEVFVLNAPTEYVEFTGYIITNAKNCKSSGEIELHTNGDAYEYTIGDDWTTSDAIIVPIGILNEDKIMVRSTNGCTATLGTGTIEVLDQAAYDTKTMVITHTVPTCQDANDGTITIENIGSDFQYKLDGYTDYSTSTTFTELSGGKTFDLVVYSTSSECVYSRTGIKLPSPQEATIDNVTTGAGTITITASEIAGSNNGIANEDMGDITYSIGNGYQASNIFTGLAAGDYNVSIKYGECVTEYGSVAVTGETYAVTFHVTDGTNPLSSAYITINGSNYYTDSNGDATVGDYEPGTYNYTIISYGFNNYSGTVIVTDAAVTENVSLSPAPLEGTLIIISDGDGKSGYEYGCSLEATLTDGNNTGTLQYQWLRAGSVISNATSNTYTPVVADIGSAISVNVTSTVQTETLTATTPIIVKAEQNAPDAPTLASRTSTSITLTTVEGCEYLFRDEWHDSPVFTGLTPNTEYDFKQRYAETATLQASTSSSRVSFSTTEAEAAVVSIPDANFKAALVASYDTNGDGEIQVSEAEAVTWILDVHSLEISDLTGIEAFINITRLYCHLNNLSSLDLSANTRIYNLQCYSNQLTSLDVSNCTELSLFDCRSNQLTSLDISNNTELVFLNCSSNQLTSLSVSTNTELNSLGCESNQIQNLNVNNNTALTELWCGRNELTTIDVSTCPNLTSLECYNNNLTSLNIANGNCSNMTTVTFSSNTNLTCVQIDEGFTPPASGSDGWTYDSGVSFSADCNAAVEELTGNVTVNGGNQYGDTIYVSIANCNNTGTLSYQWKRNGVAIDGETFAGRILSASDIGTTITVDVTSSNETGSITGSLGTVEKADRDAPAQPTLASKTETSIILNTVEGCEYCAINSMTTIDPDNYPWQNSPEFTGLSADTEYSCMQRYAETATHNASLSSGILVTTDGGVAEPVVNIPNANFKAALLDNEYININGDDEIQVSEAEGFEGKLNIRDLSISDLTGIEAFVNIVEINCARNNLSSLDVSNNTELTSLLCSSNQLTSLDVSNNPELTILFCHANSLTSLNLANGNTSSFRSAVMLDNPGLSCVQIDEGFTPPASTTGESGWQYDDGVSFSTNCGSVASNDATLSDLKVGGIAVDDFSASVYNYEYIYSYCAMIVATNVTATATDANATVVIDEASPSNNNVATITVTAEDGTTQLTYTVAFSSTDEIVITNVTVTNPQCYTDGSINIEATGGYGSLEYGITWNVGTAMEGSSWQSTGLFENLGANDVVVSVRDENGCVATWNDGEPVTLSTPSLVIATSKTDVTANSANDGRITVSASINRALANVTYQYGLAIYTEEEPESLYREYQTSDVFENLPPNEYVVVVLATIENCDKVLNDYVLVEITEPAQNALTGTVTITGTYQYGETLTAEVSESNNTGTLSYQWQRNGSNISGATAQTYTVTEADINNLIDVIITSSVETGSITNNLLCEIEKANREAPSAPTLASKTYNSIVLNTVSGCEYAINGGDWQTSATFNNLTAETEYSLTQRYAETTTHKASEASGALNVTTEAEPANALTGTVTITGTLQYGEVLTVVVSNSNNTGTLSYQWKRNGSNISGATTETYTLNEADIEAEISVDVTSTVEEGTISSSSTATIEKADQSAPAAPTLASKSHNSVELNPVTGCQYAIGGGTWQASSSFAGLLAETDYSFTQRYAETTTHKASAASAALVVTTDEEPINALTGIVTVSGTLQYSQQLTANVSATNNTGVLSYQWKRDGADISGATAENYTLAEADINATISVEVSSSVESGSIESAATATIEKADQTAPATPTLASKSHNSVELNPVTGCQYAIGGGAWQASSSFTGLLAETDYSFTQRYAETTTHKASAASAALIVTTDEEPINALTGIATISGTLQYSQQLTANVSATNNSGVLSYQWKRDGVDISGATAENYTLAEADINATISVEVSSSVETGSIESAATATIEKADQAAPAAPTLASKSHNSVELNPVAGCQYAIGGGTWQASAGFAGLSAETNYSFTQRYAETTTHKASSASTALVVTTDEEPVNALTGIVTISGTLQYSQELTANVSATNNSGVLSYQWKRDGVDVSGATAENYTLAEADINATISVEVSSSVETGSIESAATATIEKADQEAPLAPTLAEKSFYSIALDATDGCEYAINGGSWKATPAFTGLVSDTEYSFTQRYAETATHNASGASAVLTVTTNRFDINSVVNDLQVNGISISGFSSNEIEYTVEIPREFEGIPETEVFTTNSGVAITVNDAVEIPGTTTITVISPDGSQTLVYTIHFVWAPANDASLQGITINGEELSDFDADVFEYTLRIENPENIPQVSALAFDDNANVDILQAAGIPGQAIITVTAEDGKTQQVYTINFEPETSSDNFNIANIKAYPNPTSGIVNVEVPGQSKISKVCLINVTGKVIAVKNKMSAHFVTFDLTNLKQGVYFITIENEEKNQIVKRVIKK